MPTGRSSASALLQKVNSQLRGERVPLKTKEEDELAVYLSGIAKKTQQVRSGSFDDYGDISISSGKDGLNGAGTVGRPSASPAGPTASTPATSKFLKKKIPQTTSSSGAGSISKFSKPMYEDEDDNADLDDLDYKGESQIVIAGKKKDKVSVPAKSALNKVTALTNKIKGRRTDGVPLRHQLSRDSDSESEFGRRPGSADTSIGRDGRKFLKGRKLLDEDEPAGRGTPSPMLSQKESSKDSKKKTHKKSSKARGEIVRTLGNVYLTSEEESLAEFIHGLSASDSSFRRPQNLVAKKQQKWRKKTPSPAARKTPSPAQHSRSPSPFKRSPSPFGRVSRSHSQDSDNVDSMASEIMDAARTRHDSASSDDPLNINLMDVASLIPVSPRNKAAKTKKSQPAKKQKETSAFQTSSSGSIFKASSDNLSKSNKKKKENKAKPLKKSDSKSSVFESLGVHMVDELLEADIGHDAALDLSDQSEIVTERSEDRKKAAFNYESDSDIITELGAGSRAAPARSLSSEMSVSEEPKKGNVGKQSRRKKLESHEGSSTEGDYSDDSFESDSRTLTQTQSVSPKLKKKSQHRTQRGSVSHETSKQQRIVVEQREMQVTTADPLGQAHQWNSRQTGVSVSGPYGLQYMDPAPVATQVISADALEAVTAYSPGVLALHEMMKAQVELVKNFADIQRRIYHSCLDGIKEDFQYTTLEDTKEYIRQNQKPKMTFKEALELVEQEEGVRS